MYSGNFLSPEIPLMKPTVTGKFTKDTAKIAQSAIKRPDAGTFEDEIIWDSMH
jgi:hypothetical protein